MADRFVRDPNDVVKVGQKVKVTVMSVDLERGRIALSMRGGAPQGGNREQKPGNRERGTGNRGSVAGSGIRDRDNAKPAIPKPGTIAPNGMRFR
jgi:uncharacterized protein